MRYQIATVAVALTLCATPVDRADGEKEKHTRESYEAGAREHSRCQGFDPAITRDGDLYKVLDVLAKRGAPVTSMPTARF